VISIRLLKNYEYLESVSMNGEIIKNLKFSPFVLGQVEGLRESFLAALPIPLPEYGMPCPYIIPSSMPNFTASRDR
jgi:hypothetical protein